MAVDLEAMAQPGLHDALAPLDLVDEPMEVGEQVRVEVVEVGGDDGAEQDAAEAGRRLDRQDAVAERDPARR